ncbi:MAG: carbamoyltransferase HypF [Chlorobiaceae bacterium]|nr:carbamoyltransferase HypF [Chlorobiaceae bacterium]NTV60493.1 carbamoyltransferase HypF [Chlorobiaceae bacterium]
MVQGVGFRPFVYRIAVAEGLTGFIRNTASGVLIEVQGRPGSVGEFSRRLCCEGPPLSRIEAIVETALPPGEETEFSIGVSGSGEEVETLVPPDIALCRDCRRELFDPSDRRFRYPFINCTNCGPRYTIVDRLPYDRPFTSMHGFTMCPECEREYRDPFDRRFHAQPNACPVCGPRAVLLDASGELLDVPDAVAGAAAMLRQGKIVALKGVGGFHLTVDASNGKAVENLRERKGREAKPFAVMMRDPVIVSTYCSLSPVETEALSSPEAPIVLLRKKANDGISSSVAPGNDRLGVMLPYSPLHALLCADAPEVLVMTSANFSEEPIVTDNEEAIIRLGGIADFFLVHDRPIYLKCDDSVTVELSGRLRQLRRSRGYVPVPVFLRQGGPVVLGTGGELKNTLALLKGNHALLSQHIGDMKNYDAFSHFEHAARHLQHLFQATPELIVHDLHPGYMTTRWAEEQGLPVLGVQHHHAHLASCLAENREGGPVIGLILDGTGYGTDGTIWGGEVLIGDESGAERFAMFEKMPIAGGETAIIQPWRLALGYLWRSSPELPALPFMEGRPLGPVLELLRRGTGVPETSSCGRLFDAVAALVGLRGEISYEGQAAIELMHAAGPEAGTKAFPHEIKREKGLRLMLVSPVVMAVAHSVNRMVPVPDISRMFHRTLVNLFLDIISEAATVSGIRTVALSGGVFQNALLFETLVTELENAGYRTLTHSLVPSNDGGLSLGQAVIGRSYLAGRYLGVS